MEDNRKFAIVRVLTGLFLFYFYWSVWAGRAPLLAIGHVMRFPDPLAIALILTGGVASLSFAAGLWVRTSAAINLVCLSIVINVFFWLYSIELVHLIILLAIFAFFAGSQSWSDSELRDKKLWYLPTFLVFYFGFSISGVSKTLYSGWHSGHVVEFLCKTQSPLAGVLGTAICDKLPGGAMGTFVVMAEALTFPFAIFKSTRWIAWLLFSFVNLGAYLMIQLFPVTTGMFIVQLFFFDPEWIAFKGGHDS
jgi:hypothetical protein